MKNMETKSFDKFKATVNDPFFIAVFIYESLYFMGP